MYLSLKYNSGYFAVKVGLGMGLGTGMPLLFLLATTLAFKYRNSQSRIFIGTDDSVATAIILAQ